MNTQTTKKYNKLVRDKIPAIIESNGDMCKTRILSQEEYMAELDKKLSEELAEYQESKSLEELADMLEVMMSIAKTRGHDWSDVMVLRWQKLAERGGFDKRIFLEETWKE